jgi:antirestriction protein ArdC
MARYDRSARSDRSSLYDDITNKIIAELEAGRVPWVQPWGTSAAKAPLGLKNAATGRTYSGVNVLILWGAVIERGFPAQSWLTFRQPLALGGNVRKGERGTTVVYADRFIPGDEKKRARETGDEAQGAVHATNKHCAGRFRRSGALAWQTNASQFLPVPPSA